MTSTGPVPNFVPEVAILDIPFLIRDYPHARAVLDGPIGQEMLTKFPAKGIVALAWGENGFRHMTNSKRPVNAPDDLKGLKMRTMENPGAHPGVQAVRHHPDADGVHRSVHRAAAGHRRRPGESAVRDLRGQVRPGAEVHDAHRPRLFAGADPDEQGASGTSSRRPTSRRSLAAAKEAVKANRARIDEDERKAVADLRAKGMIIVENVDKAKFQATLAPTFVEFGKKFGQDNIDKIKNYK